MTVCGHQRLGHVITVRPRGRRTSEALLPRIELCLARVARAGPASVDRESHLPRASARGHVLSYGDAHGRSTVLQQPKLLLNPGLTFMDVSANNVEWVTPSCPMPSEGMRSP